VAFSSRGSRGSGQAVADYFDFLIFFLDFWSHVAYLNIEASYTAYNYQPGQLALTGAMTGSFVDNGYRIFNYKEVVIMIKVLFSGLFNVRKGTFFYILAVMTGFVVGCSDTTGPSNDNHIEPATSINRFVAEPTQSVGSTKITQSFSYDGYDFYYIHVGVLRNVVVASVDAIHHDGIHTPFRVSVDEAIRNITAERVTTNHQTATNIIEEHTMSRTRNVSASQEIGLKFPIKKILATANIRLSAEQSWNSHVSSYSYTEFREFTSLETESIRISDESRATSIGTERTFTQNHAKGWYRFTRFGDFDVYLYVIKSPITDSIHYEFKKYEIPHSFGWKFDFCEDRRFERNNDSDFEFDYSILDNLPTPEVILRPRSVLERKTITETFSSSRDWSLPAEVTFPATIEFLLFGAGGGGQGGHAHTFSTTRGAGGGGGSGAAVYMKLNTENPIVFSNITVGTGGNGGSCYLQGIGSWQSGNSGNSGGASSIRINNTTITAGGGNGGGGSGQNVSGGSGGTPNPISRPVIDGATVLEYNPIHGNPGQAGAQNTSSNRYGGSALSIDRYSAGGGGRSGWDCLFGTGGVGDPGSSGRIIIIVTYFEES